jgi:hypothetical protein
MSMGNSYFIAKPDSPSSHSQTEDKIDGRHSGGDNRLLWQIFVRYQPGYNQICLTVARQMRASR